MDNLYALIMAGGGGTRLWPRSRQGRPKQFLNIGAPHSLLREAFLRVAPLIPPERVLVITGQSWIEAVREELPEVLEANILGEPQGRGTAPAIGLAAQVLAHRDPNAILAALTADHLIRDHDKFRAVLCAAARAADEGYIALLGITPTEPNTGYGYIEADARVTGSDDMPVLKVKSFKEKPTQDRAEQFFAAGNYYWNSGMFVWRVDTILAAFQEFIPDTANRLTRIGDAWGGPDQEQVLSAEWPGIKNETIDYAVAERATNVLVVPADIGWNDVGSWAALFDVLPSDADDNIVEGEYISVDSRNNLIYSPHRLVACLGVEDLVIVDTNDVLLVLPRSRAQDVRAIVAEIRKRGLSELL